MTGRAAPAADDRRRGDARPRIGSVSRARGVAGSARRRPVLRAAWLLFAATMALSADAASAATVRARVGSGQFAALVNRHDLYLEAEPLRGEGLLAFCRRLTGSGSSCREISRLNRNPRRLLAGVRYRVPFERLAGDLQVGVIRALFEADRVEPSGWVHRGRGESLQEVALWFAGDASRASRLRADNRRSGDSVRAGEEIRIALDLLTPPFRALVPALPVAESSPVTELLADAADAALEYGKDDEGAFAIYRLRGGEALYSAVVVRFTGRDRAEDVNALAGEIAKRSGIPDVTDIPVGYPVRIPFDLLLPQYLPEDDPRRLEWEVERKLAEQFSTPPVQATGLSGVTVVLDAGHGGADVGASRAGVWESIYVYDVVQRIERALNRRTLAAVVTTTRDGTDRGPIERDVLPYSRRHAVLTDPPYPITDATVGVHLRWYLANSEFRRHSRAGQGDRMVFVSVHADSLHPSLRGATVYIPNAAGMAGSYGKRGTVFSSRREVREQPTVSFALRERQKSEGRSRNLAEKIIAGFRSHRLAVHPFQPVRDRIFRGRRAWVPAVLRYNAIPAKVLVEICNLANAEDRKLLQTIEFRESIADAVVDGILAFFGERRGATSVAP